jgi:hypothetical protein
MLNKANLTLTGLGYLNEVSVQDDGLYARINVINKFNSGAQRSDDIWIIL